MADGDAEGVYVDIAIVMPVVQPRYVEELGAVGEELDNKSLHDFREICLWVSGFEAPVLGELKPGPTRHADNIKSFYLNLTGLLRQGMLQVEAQALCLFCSWRFATQSHAILLAGAGDYYRVCRVTREWAVEELDGAPYSSETLKKLKAVWGERGDVDLDDPDNHDVNAVEDGDWTEGQLGHMYGTPLDAHDRQQKLNNERTLRRLKRNAQREKYLNAITVSSSRDRTAPLFTNEALNDVHRGAVAGPMDGHVSYNLARHSDQYMAEIQVFIRQREQLEEARGKNVFFTKMPPTNI
ncbi:hypothetical protein B0H12DRAFT_1068695 [Mycena haematopus]|nr:hypothetical protein B0H12DRAFT_1068695 [Mycena haematopus]